MTREQKIFQIGLKKLDAFDDVRKKRDLNVAEITEENKIKEVLFGLVRNYGVKLAQKMTQKYRLPSDSFSDLCQELAIIFYKQYRNYDPTRTTPTTYFDRYFKQKITSYLVENVHKLSQYDANNVLKVKAAINYYESIGVKWTEEMLANKTGLSIKVIHSTLFFSYSSNYAEVEEAYSLKAKIKTPEEAYTEKETTEVLMRAIVNNTDSDERELLMMRINLNGSKEMPYEKVAKNNGLSVRDVKRKINSCICRINQDRDIVERFSKSTFKNYKDTLVLQENISGIMEEQLGEFLMELQAVSN